MTGDDFDPALELELELEEGIAAAAAVDVLPADFPLPRLIKFVPDAAKQAELARVTAWALAFPVTGEAGIAQADAAVTLLRARLEAVKADYDDPKTLAYQLHARITRLLADATAEASAAVKTIGERMYAEKKRLEVLAADARHKAQADADATERARLSRAAAEAARAGVPAAAVRELEAEAATASAAPVPVVPARKVAGSAFVATWKARPKGTPADADPNPEIGEMSPAQVARVFELLEAIVTTKHDLTAIEVNYSVLNGRAKSDKQAFSVPGFEAFEAGGTRAKGRRL